MLLVRHHFVLHFSGKGNTSRSEGIARELEEQLVAGAIGFVDSLLFEFVLRNLLHYNSCSRIQQVASWKSLLFSVLLTLPG